MASTTTIARSPGKRITQQVISTKWIDILRDGDTDGDYQSTHAAVMAIAVPCVHAGWTVHDWVTAMTDPTNALAAHYQRKDDGRRRTRSNSHGRILRDWAKAVRYAADKPRISDPREVMQHLGLVRAAMAGAGWNGRTGLRDRIILGVILDIAEAKPTACPTVSIRSLCEQTPYRGNQTVMRAIHHLTESGWLTPDRSRSRADEPTAYRVNLPDVCTSGATGCALPGGDGAAPSVHSLTGPVDRVSHDLGIRFGAHAALIYSALDPDIGQPVASIVARSGAARRTVYKWLPELAVMGLSYRTPKDGWFQGLRDVELVALENGALDLTEARTARHDLQRRGFAQWLADQAAAHSAQHGGAGAAGGVE